MNLKRNIVTLLICAMFAFTCGTFAGGLNKKEFKKMTNSEKAIMILEKSAKIMSRDNIQTIILPEGIKEVVFSKKTKDGINYTKYDFYDIDKQGKEKFQYSMLTRGDERWNLINEYALKLPDFRSFTRAELKSIEKFITEYRVEEELIGDIECYVVSDMLKTKGQGKLIKLNQTIVRKKDFVEIGNRDYSQEGKLLLEINVKEVEFKSLDDSIFQIPKNKTIKTFKNWNSYSDFHTKLLEKE